MDTALINALLGAFGLKARPWMTGGFFQAQPIMVIVLFVAFHRSFVVGILKGGAKG